MAFSESPRFPEDISYGAAGGPEYKTTITQNDGGYEQRLGRWEYPLHSYDVAYGAKYQSDIVTIKGFFMNVRGRLTGFRFKDHQDFSATGEAIGTGDTVEVDFQLIKTYASGASSEIRNIKKPVSGTVNIYVGAVLQTETTHYTIDYTTGIVTFVSAPGSSVAVTADYEFDVPVRFNVDYMRPSIDDYDIVSWGQIPLVELR